MSIRFTCENPQCGKRIKVPDTAAGKRVRCPQCRQTQTIPNVSDEAEPNQVDSLLQMAEANDSARPEMGVGYSPLPPAASQPEPYGLADDTMANGSALPAETAAGFGATPYASRRSARQVASGLGIIGSLIGAAGGALLGALVWFALEYFVEIQIGYVAILCGAAAGWGAVLIGKQRNAMVGLIAAVAGLAGILGGSYACFYLVTHGERFEAEMRPVFEEFYAEAARTDPEIAAWTPEQKDASYKAFSDEIRENLSFVDYAVGEGADALFLLLFGGLGLYYGFRVGSGGGAGN